MDGNEIAKYLGTLNELALLLVPQFPAGIMYNRHEECWWIFRASWPLADQPKGFVTISREVTIRVGRDNLANYHNYDSDKKRRARDHLQQLVNQRMADYDEGRSEKQYAVLEPFIIDVQRDWAIQP
ncbi:hypothetical protein ABXT34_15110 [Ralstonia sp. SM1884_UCD616_TZ26]|uniref:hypothetical protein n=1 Tax=Ralstonia pseudosolanacearum TaxID=1310165 RepID=UPI00339B7E41